MASCPWGVVAFDMTRAQWSGWEDERRALRPGVASVVALAVVLALTSCVRAPVSVPARSGGYPAASPVFDMSGALSTAFQSVKQIQVSVEYRVHVFAEANAPTERDLATEDVTARAVSTETYSEITRASAVVLTRSDRNVLLLTAAHAAFRPDTTVQYFGPAGTGGRDRRLRSLSIKSRQTNWVLDQPGARPFELLAWDEDADVAVIGFPFLDTRQLGRPTPLGLVTGEPGALEPGSFVYILGYPGGYRMVSSGLATPLDRGDGAFVVDGNWNQGVSGGLILAVRGGTETLEWVGMARAAAATREPRFLPPESALEQHDPAVPYEGPIFLEETLRIQYGVTLSVPITTIRRFLERHRARLTGQGYDVPRL